MKLRLAMLTLLLALPALALPALAQQQPRNQVTIMREIDSDRYDPHRTTALAGGEVLTMLSDTLVSIDFDMRSIRPGLAERWEVSPDGLVYTFHLRQGVTFCDGKPFTADDVIFSVNRSRAQGSNLQAVMGSVKEMRKIDDLTIEGTRCTALNAADLNQDGHVNGGDLGLLLSQWGTAGSADLNHDGIVDGNDLGQLLAAWTN